APFFLGLALTQVGSDAQALAAFLRTPAKSLFRPFALAGALKRYAVMPEPSPEAIAELDAELHTFFFNPMPLPAPYIGEAATIRPMGFELETPQPSADLPQRILTRWLRENVMDDTESVEFDYGTGPGDSMWLSHGRRVLELRWVTNLAPFGDFDTIPPDKQPVPGWVEPLLKENKGGKAHIEPLTPPDTGQCLTLQSDSDAGEVRIGTIPLVSSSSAWYVVAVRCQSDGAKLFAGWEWSSAKDESVQSHNIVNQVLVDGWQWYTEYQKWPANATTMRVWLGIYRSQGRALFDQVAVFPLEPPQF
ncbi:MAG: hypothetical protein QG656_1441, partial [Candidatus Hydrogenedentes bacterium]|nr:hypothetical protein [Candidatus Hydrogenedentota bacterium]